MLLIIISSTQGCHGYGNLYLWWVINSSLYHTGATNRLLLAKARNEIEWINKVNEHAKGNFVVISWSPDEIKGEKLRKLI